MRYINIHTHQQTPEAEVFQIYNCIIDKEETTAHYFSAGIHPWHINKENQEAQLQKLKSQAKDAKCLAIGECGLDKTKGADIKIQEFIFREHIKLATELNKPLVIHCVKAFQEVLNCLKSEKFQGNFIIHGFNSGLDKIVPLLKMPNAYFSFGNALIKNGSNAELLIKILPLNRVFLETDDSTINIKNIYDAAVEINSISEQALVDQLINNYKKVFIHGID